MAPRGAARGVGRCRWRREGYRRGDGCGRAGGSAALTRGPSWAGGGGKSRGAAKIRQERENECRDRY